MPACPPAHLSGVLTLSLTLPALFLCWPSCLPACLPGDLLLSDEAFKDDHLWNTLFNMGSVNLEEVMTSFSDGK